MSVRDCVSTVADGLKNAIPKSVADFIREVREWVTRTTEAILGIRIPPLVTPFFLELPVIRDLVNTLTKTFAEPLVRELRRALEQLAAGWSA